jgi:hypothetical protein
MSSELVYRMRTCAAALASNGEPPLILLRDAADLLIEASNVMDVPELLGEPMEVLRKVAEAQTNVAPRLPPDAPAATWGGSLNATVQPCPSCGAIDARTVHRSGRKLMITCPTCTHQWEYGRAA